MSIDHASLARGINKKKIEEALQKSEGAGVDHTGRTVIEVKGLHTRLKGVFRFWWQYTACHYRAAAIGESLKAVVHNQHRIGRKMENHQVLDSGGDHGAHRVFERSSMLV